jgi:hypothetical protein
MNKLPENPTGAEILAHARSLTQGEKEAAQVDAEFNLELWQRNLKQYKRECNRTGRNY